ncbi:MAG: DUF3099 domain-containing protein [Corynebacterium sp.]|nr:DUF3099 domain-containing protein [Corynebacterium sp.]
MFGRRRDIALITSKEKSDADTYRRRIIIYNCMQFSRPPLLILAGLSYLVWHTTILSIILFVLCVPISWISVVIANGHGQPRDPRERQVYKPAAARQQAQYELTHQQTPQLEKETRDQSEPPL